MREFDFIRHIKALNPHEADGPLGNDCFPFTLEPGATGLISKDLLVEGVHFYPEIPLKALAHKALTVNLTDILSDGGTPLFFMAGIGCPKERAPDLKELYRHFNEFSAQHGVPIRGGDSVASPVFFLSITCVGQTFNRPWLRKNARPGDFLYVTGTLGGSAAGLLKIAQKGHDLSDPLIFRHLFPPYRSGLERVLKNRVHGALDLSDGLLPDLAKILTESKTGAEIEVHRIPLETGATLKQAYFGGEDYEILFSSPEHLNEEALFEELGFAVTRIGKITPEPGQVCLKSEKGEEHLKAEELIRGGFNHWNP